MKKIGLYLCILFLSSCNKQLMEYCKKENAAAFDACKKECELALPDPVTGLTKEEAVKKCKERCSVKNMEDRLNCYYSRDAKCIRKCTRNKAKECRKDKRDCKRIARTTKRNCINQARGNKRNCIRNCRRNLRGRQRRRCIRTCRRTFRAVRRNCRRTFRAAKSQCTSVDCKKSTFYNECVTDCGKG